MAVAQPTTDPKTVPFSALVPCLARRQRAGLVADLVPLADLAVLLPAVTLLAWLAPQEAGGGPSVSASALAAAVLATLMLYDPRLGAQAGRSQWAALAGSHARRFAVYAGAMLVLALLSGPAVHASAAGPSAIGAAAVRSGWPGNWVGTWLAIAAVLTTATRVLAAAVVHRLRQRGQLTERVAVVGDGPVARRLLAALAAAPPKRVELLGVFGDGPRPAASRATGARTSAASGSGSAAGGSVDDLAALARAGRIDWIVLAPETSDDLLEHERQNQLQRRLLGLGVPLGLCPPQIGLSALDLPAAAVGDRLALGLLAQRPIRQWDALVKALEDWVLGALLLVLLAPLLGLIALAIRIDSPGPVLFRQRRHALDNREFDIYKFRTMRVASAQDWPGRLVQTVRGDARVTRLGRWLRATSLDELPQLFNVLEGSMSLVGPRPHAVDMRTDARLGHEITARYSHRHRVKPGITGWAQVNGARGATETPAQLRRRVALDLHYIAHWSLWLDLRILLMTAGAVLRRTNAF